jgi:hypothetical protein
MRYETPKPPNKDASSIQGNIKNRTLSVNLATERFEVKNGQTFFSFP